MPLDISEYNKEVQDICLLLLLLFDLFKQFFWQQNPALDLVTVFTFLTHVQ